MHLKGTAPGVEVRLALGCREGRGVVPAWLGPALLMSPPPPASSPAHLCCPPAQTQREGKG